MKRVICLALSFCLIIVCLAGCGEKREMFNVKLDEHVELTDYKAISIDKTSDEFLNYLQMIFENYVASASAYDKLTTGTVKDGDTVNIDYTGKKDGKAFDGGTATGQNLVIGSKSFIDGFESGLIGKAVGSTVDLHLTFPKEYQAKELAGQNVVFTVKINYVQAIPEKNDATAKKLGFDDFNAMNADLEENTIKNLIAQKLIEKSSVKKYSSKDKEKYDAVYNDYIASMQQYTASYNQQYGTNITVDEMLYYNLGATATELKSNITSQMESEMILYAVLDKEGLKVTEDDVNNTVKSMVNANTSEAQVRENYKSWTLETITVERIVIDHLANNVVTVK